VTSITKKTGTFSVKAYQGDAKTLLAFDFSDKAGTKNLAGFTIQTQPKGQPAYYVHNELQFKTPGDHAQVEAEPAKSSVNAPIHKFRWVHVPGSVHQGTEPFRGPYTYTVTPRYFDAKGRMLAVDPKNSVALTIDVVPFVKNGLALGFARGFTQSQAFVNHFGKDAQLHPKNDGTTPVYDTSKVAGTNAQGEKFTYAQAYEWLGFTAREQIFAVLNGVLKDSSLSLDMFAYDLNEPDVIQILLKLAAQGRIRVILDNATLHHNAKKPTAEDQFEALFRKAAKKGSAILRGKFGRYAHDKVFVVKNSKGAVRVLTGSTNFSVTGIYVNSNHVLVFEDATVANTYAGLFAEAWKDQAKLAPYKKSKFSTETFSFASAKTPKTEITFAPHADAFVSKQLGSIAARIKQEAKKGKTEGSVLFAVMDIGSGSSAVYDALKTVHANQKIFSYGITDTTNGIALYKPGTKTGVLTTGKPASTQLPPPFDQVPNIGGVGHQIHHKFVICGFNTPDAVVYCGSSNLAGGGEANNGDNLLTIHDGDVATVFAIEALGLVDHFNFLDAYQSKSGAGKSAKKPAQKAQAAAQAEWFLSTTDKWAAPYFDPKDLHCVDRQLFG
jgi:phospholipase D-like protein